jgi:biopolymer transport protein ExbD
LLVALPLALAQPQSPLDPAFTPFAKASVDAHQPAGAPITLPIEPHVAIEFHANGSSSLTLDQFNSPAVSRTLAQIAVRKPRSLVLIRHTGQTNHVAVVNAARLCRDAGLRCTFVSNFSSDTSPQLPPEFRALPSKTRLVSLNVDAAGKFALRAYGFSKADLLATLAELQSPASRVVVGSREFFREFSSVQLAARAIATGQ